MEHNPDQAAAVGRTTVTATFSFTVFDQTAAGGPHFLVQGSSARQTFTRDTRGGLGYQKAMPHATLLDGQRYVSSDDRLVVRVHLQVEQPGAAAGQGA